MTNNSEAYNGLSVTYNGLQGGKLSRANSDGKTKKNVKPVFWSANTVRYLDSFFALFVLH